MVSTSLANQRTPGAGKVSFSPGPDAQRHIIGPRAPGVAPLSAGNQSADAPSDGRASAASFPPSPPSTFASAVTPASSGGGGSAASNMSHGEVPPHASQ